ncbi:MAG TPA: class I SAM-dependent methyltransferase [Acidimicrobiales bacterium]|nr:class I SAM-dependent methyltransferase [Acidimicrobiales bacterium]
MTGQERIWEYYQNEAPGSFAGAEARLSFLVSLVRPGERVLNVGVGAGTFERLATERGALVHSLDPDEAAIERVRGSLGLGNLARTGHVQAMPFSDGSLDVVVASEVLEHLPDDDLVGAVEEAARVLVPGGRLLVTVPAREDLVAHVVVCPDCGSRFHRWGHLQSFDAARLAATVAPRFDVDSITERPFATWSALNWKGRLLALVKRALSRAGVHGSGENLVLVAHKRPN